MILYAPSPLLQAYSTDPSRVCANSCPYCANQLGLVEGTSGNKFGCQTCPYEYPLNKRYMERTYLKRKAVDDVLGGEDSWKNVDSTAVDCPKECGSDRAFFMQIQIRSADEPSTTFYKGSSALGPGHVFPCLQASTTTDKAAPTP
ncbi:RNA polymerase III C11 subunit [Rhodotorula toruloides]